MKPTVTNCFDCWTEDQRATPAAWAVGDDFFCDAHLRKAQIDPASAVTIEAYKQAHGIKDPVHIGDPTKFNGKAFRSCPCGKRLRHGSTFDKCAKCRRKDLATETNSKPKHQESEMKETAGEPRICSREGCGKVLKSSNTSGRCTKHFYVPKGTAPKKNGKAPRMGAGRPAAASDTRTSQPSSESAHIALTRDQLVTLFKSWPIERQAAAIQAVFVQELSLA